MHHYSEMLKIQRLDKENAIDLQIAQSLSPDLYDVMVSHNIFDVMVLFAHCIVMKAESGPSCISIH